jgi:hypothetical protein
LGVNVQLTVYVDPIPENFYWRSFENFIKNTTIAIYDKKK